MSALDVEIEGLSITVTVTARLEGWFMALDALEDYTHRLVGFGADPDLAKSDIKEIWDPIYAIVGEAWTKDRDLKPSAPVGRN